MKKIFSVIMAFCMIIPCAFIFCACGNNDDKNNSGDLDINAVYELLLENLEDISKSSTINVDVEYEYGIENYVNNTKSASNENSGSFDNNKIKINDGNYYFNISELGESYTLKTGENFIKDKDNNSWGLYHMSENAMFPGAAYVTVIKDIVKTIGIDEVFDDIKDIAVNFDSEALSVKQEDGTKTIQLTIDFSSFIKKTISNILTNKDNVLELFINQLLKDYTGKEVDVLDDLKSFTDELNSETTVGDLLDFVEDNYHINLLPLVYSAYGIFGTNTFSNVQLHNSVFEPSEECQINVGVYENANNEFINEISINQITNKKILELLKLENSSKESVYNFMKNYLQNEELSIGIQIENMIVGDENDMTAEQLYSYLEIADFKNVSIDFAIELNQENKISSFEINAGGRCLLLDDTGTGKAIGGSATAKISFSNVGTTVITPPTEQIESMYIMKHIKKNTLNAEDIVISLESYPPLNANISYKVYYVLENEEGQQPVFDEELSTVATYNKSTKVFTISRDFYNKVTTQEPSVNSIYFNDELSSLCITIIFD